LALPKEREGTREVREVLHSEIFGAAGSGKEGRRKWDRRMKDSLPSFNRYVNPWTLVQEKRIKEGGS